MSKPLVCLEAVLLVGGLACGGLASDWPQFRGPGGQGVSTATGLPFAWSETENLVWKTALPGQGSSSPIALGGKIYVTCYSGYGRGHEGAGSVADLVLHVVCAGGASGKIAWDRRIRPEAERDRVREHGYAASTPATDGKHLFVFFGKTGVFKLDLEGKTIWRASVGSKTHGWGCGTSPVLYKNLVIINASVESGSLVALDKETGKEVWRFKGMKSSWNTPHLVDVPGGKTELAVSIKGSILGFDPQTGETLWSASGIQDYVCPSIVSRNGIVYAMGGRTSRTIAVRAGGRGDVTKTHTLWEARAGANVSSPVICGKHLYWVSDRNTTAYCLRLDDGVVVHAARFRGQPYASTLLADGKLYVVTRRGGVFVCKADPEMEVLARNRFSDRSIFDASAIVADNHLILRSDKYLYCVGTNKTGR